MSLLNETKNQHFLPQIEQRFNAINPAAQKSNQRIFQFNLIDRETYRIKLRSKRGERIASTLRLLHLFSFDVIQKKASLNFESLFLRYESEVEAFTKRLLKKVSQAGAGNGEYIKEEIVNIFAIKFLNFVRNPYSIKKVLNSFPALLSHAPVAEEHLELFSRVLEGNRPHEEYICGLLDINQKQYQDWLHILFLLLTPLGSNQQNLVEQCVIQLFNSKENILIANINTYSKEHCLLSDRGYIDCLEGEDHLAFGFNLTSKAFITYTFGDLDALTKGQYPKAVISRFKESQKSASVNHVHDCIDDLVRYNRHAVYQCHQSVYGAAASYPGVLVV